METLKVFIILLFGISPSYAMEQEAVVIEIRKKVKLHKTEKVYPDYFINGGTKMGLDTGAVVSVVRRVPVHDPFLNSSIGDFRIKVADVEIIQADSEKAIARLMGVDRRSERPMVKYDAVMVGDRLDLATLRSKKVASAEPFLMPSAPKPSLLEEVGNDPNLIMDKARKVSSAAVLPSKKPLPEKVQKPKKDFEKETPKLTNPAMK